MKRTRISLVMAAAALALILGSCAEGPVGIFASVAAETDINKHATKEFKGTSPSFVAKLDDTYYAGIGGLWKRHKDATKWTKANTSFLGSGDFSAISAATKGVYMYIVFVNTSNRAHREIWRTADGSNWAPISVPAGITAAGSADFENGTVHSISHFLATNDELFLVSTTNTYVKWVISTTVHTVWYFNDTAFIAAGNPTVTNASIGLPASIAHTDDTININYWLSAGRNYITSLSNNSPVSLASEDASENISGVFALGANVFFSGRDGKIYNSDTSVSSGVFKDFNGRPYSFSIPAVVTAGGQTTLLVPSRAYPQGTVRDQGLGYLEFDAASFDTAKSPIAEKQRRISTLNNYFITLDGKSVKQILAFEEGGARRLFALTDGDGLWSNFFDGGTPGSWSGWRRE